MIITFVHFVLDVMVSYSHAIASLAASLNASGHKVSLVVVRNKDFNSVVDDILLTKPDIICLSYMSNQSKTASNLANLIRIYNPKIPIWAGGSHTNALPTDFMNSEIDAVCYGEGEEILLDAIHAYKNGQLFEKTGWITKVSEKRNLTSAIVEELDSLALPLIDLFDKSDVLNYPSLMFSRGCPFHCNYCMSRMGGLGNRVRWKSVDRAILEAERLVKTFQPSEIYFDDDTLLKNPKWIQEFLSAYKKKIDCPYYCNARPEVITKSGSELLAETGCKAIGIGIESGSERLRRDILNRPMSIEQIKRAFDLIHKAGLKTWSFNMIGIPGETLDDLYETIRINQIVDTDFVRVSVYTAYPGTPLGDGLGIAFDNTSYFNALDSLTPELQKIGRDWVTSLKNQGRLWNDE
jgi:radical SAM superfamily enzyme YgiQ (UPF0313 family)